MDLNTTVSFVHVVRAGSFVKAAKTLALPTSTVSDRVAALEKALGVTLLTRTTRKLSLTDAGAKYFAKAEAAIALLSSGYEEATNLQQKPSGTLKITGPNDFAPQDLAEVIVEYQKKFPEVKIEAYLTNRRVDLIGEGFDLAIRAGDLTDSSLIAKKVGTGRLVFISHEKYLKSAAPLKHPKDLEAHSCIGFFGNDANQSEFTWHVQSNEGRKFRCKTKFRASATSFDVVIELVKAGAGVALVPLSYAIADLKRKSIVHVLQQWGTPQSAVSLVYPQQKFYAPKLRELVPLLEKRLRKTLESETL